MSDIEYSVITSDVIKSFDCILNLDHWFRRCCLKIILLLALVTNLFDGGEPLVQFW